MKIGFVRQGSFLLVLALVASSPSFPSPVYAEDPLAPPFDYSDTGWVCSNDADLPTCNAAMHAYKDTGGLALTLGITSPADGLLPGYGSAWGFTRLEVEDPLDREASKLAYEATVYIRTAEIRVEGLPGEPSYGYVSVFLDVHHQSCISCFGEAKSTLVDVRRDTRMEDETVTLQATMRERDGGAIPPGDIVVSVWIYASMRLDAFPAPRTGSVSAEVEAAAQSIVPVPDALKRDAYSGGSDP